MPASQMLPCRRHRRTRCGVTISWGRWTATRRPAQRPTSRFHRRRDLRRSSSHSRHSDWYRDVTAGPSSRTASEAARRAEKARVRPAPFAESSVMSSHPITEDDLHGFVDHLLDSARRSEVQTYLDAHPEIAARIATFSRQREALRAAAAPTFEKCRWTLRMSVYRGRPEVTGAPSKRRF